MVGFEDAAWTKGARQNNFTFGCWPMWRTHSCVPRRHSCRRPVNRGEEASRRVSELLKSPRVLGLPGENDLSQSPHVPWEGKLKHAPPRRKSARLVGHALACPSILGLITNSTTSGVRSLDAAGTSACATPFLLVACAQLCDYRQIFQSRRIAFHYAARRDLFQQTTHNLAATRLRQGLGETDIVGLGQRPDLFSHPGAQFLF